MLLGVKNELRNLNKTVVTIRGVLVDAERKAFTNPAVRAWLAELKDVVDDVIDRCRIRREKMARVSLEGSCCCCSPLSSFVGRLALRHEIGGRISSINYRLERVNRDRSALDLAEAPSARGGGGISRPHRHTAPGFEPGIIGMGIENGTNDLILRLLESRGGGTAVAILTL